MIPRKKFVAAGEVGFESSTLEKPLVMFVPAVEMPQQSPRLGKRCRAESLPIERSAPSYSDVSTPEVVRKVASCRQPDDIDKVNSYVEVKYHEKQLDT